MSDKFQGIALPWDGTIKGLIEPKNDAAVLRSSIQWIVLTRRGEVPMRRSFGTSVPDILFDPNSQEQISQIASEIETAIRKWDSRIAFVQADTKSEGNVLTVRIFSKDTTDPKKEAITMAAFQITSTGVVLG